MPDAKGMFDFTIFIGVFYFLYFVIILGEELFAGEGQIVFSELAMAFFKPMDLGSGWTFLNLLIFLPIYIFLLFTAIELMEKSIIGSHVVLGIIAVLFAGSFIALLLPEGFTIEGLTTTIKEGISEGFDKIGSWFIEGFKSIGSGISEGLNTVGSWIKEGASTLGSKIKGIFT